jgi:integrase
MIRAGVTASTGKVNKDGSPVLKAKYTGLHSLRHFYASWLINRKEDGGLGLPAKMVQERLGHASIVGGNSETYSRRVSNRNRIESSSI